MTFFHTAYGMKIRSNQSVPGLLPISDQDQVDLELTLGTTLTWHEEMSTNSGETVYASPCEPDATPTVIVRTVQDGKYYSLDYYDGTRFLVDCNGTRIWSVWPTEATLEDTATYLLGPVFAFVLRLRKVVFLHASVIQIEDFAICIAGPSGAGKSTTAAAFGLRGFPVLSDDIAALSDKNGTPYVHPSCSVIRLWPDSVTYLWGTSDALPRLTPANGINWWWDKRYLGFKNNSVYRSQPLPLAGIYILNERGSNSDPLVISSMTGQSSCMALIQNTCKSYLLDKNRRSQEFEFLGRVAAKIPVRCVTPHEDPSYIPALCDVLLEDARTLQGELFRNVQCS